MKTLSVGETVQPNCGENETVIRVEIAGIGGSEYLGYANPGIRSIPSIMCHGFSGETLNGQRVTVNPLLSCGTCQYCSSDLCQLCDSWNLIGVQSNGGFAEQVVVPSNTLVNLPDELTWEQAMFIEPFANSINARELSGAGKLSDVAIVGSGSLGLGLVGCANRTECETIDVADLSPQRLSAALQLGATGTIGTLESEAYDVVFETVGSLESRQSALCATKKGGTIVFLGFATPTMEVNISELIRHQKNLMGSFVYSRQQFCSAVDLVSIVNSNWVENLSFSEVESRLNEHLDGDFSVVKSALRPGQA